MSSIDAVIARARRPGTFSARQTFTLARTRAIQKMRHFALANPHYYVLELVQASIASGATWVALEVDHDSFTLSYVGGGFPEAGLANLFDFLFASKERAEFAALRALALGINALMLFHPRRIIIESGDGTLEGTARMEIQSDADKLEIGTPDHALAGTFIRAEGLRREAMSRELKIGITGQGLDERGIIEQRCLCAPVPIFFNSEAIFGHATMRIPRTFGYRRQIEFDEGDIFGTLALSPLGGAANFRLLTHGVWIESVEHPLVGGAPLGGTINYDALHKTADHARVVRDERLADMWVRILPYAEMLMKGETNANLAYDVAIFGGMRLPSKQLRLFLKEVGRVVVVPPEVEEGSAKAAVARRIAAALDAELLSAHPDHIERLRVLGGRDVSVIAPDLDSARALEIYTQPPAEEPARPWLLSAIDGPPLTVTELVRGLDGGALEAAEADVAAAEAAAAEATARTKDRVLKARKSRAETAASRGAASDARDRREHLEAALGARGDVTIKIFTPASAAGRGALEVRLTTCGRLVAVVSVISAFPGHVLTAELPSLRPGRFAGDEELVEATAGAIARHAADVLRDASRRAIHGLDPETIAPKTPEAHLALAALQRIAVVRMRRAADGRGEVLISPLDAGDLTSGLDLLALPILRTLSGDELGLRDLPALLRRGGGVVYGVLPEIAADLEGLDVSQILDLDRESERLLVALLGEAAYVRVDARDVLAEHAGTRIRDLALGLRDFPDFPLLVEGRDPTTLDLPARAEAERALYAALLHVYADDPQGSELAEELRRQACRHIQRYLCGAVASGVAEPLGFDVPIAMDPRGVAYSLREILAGARVHGHVVAHYDHGALPPPADQVRRMGADDPFPAELLISPFLFGPLSAIARLVLPFDFALGEAPTGARADAPDAFLATVEVKEAGLRGTLGVPLRAPEAARILLLDADLRLVHAIPTIAADFGVVGALQLEVAELDPSSVEPLFDALHSAATAALHALARRLPELEPGGAAQTRAISVLLEHAGRSLSLMATPAGTIVPSTGSELAARILSMPLFPGRHGLPVNASTILRLLAQETRRQPGAAISGSQLVAGERLDPQRRAWLDRHLHSGRIARPAGHSAAPPTDPLADAPAPATFDGLALCATVAQWIEALRPDPRLATERPGSRVHVWFAEDKTPAKGNPPCWVAPSGGTSAHVYLNPHSWLVRWAASAGETEPKALAWLILAVYAEINALLVVVTNAHEQAFQRRVAAAVAEGTIRPLAPQPLPLPLTTS
ncbi:MAG: hypothetical protein R3A79_05815 [Nannocystaceae bacterium]